jgi:hypothetical protein
MTTAKNEGDITPAMDNDEWAIYMAETFAEILRDFDDPGPEHDEDSPCCCCIPEVFQLEAGHRHFRHKRDS